MKKYSVPLASLVLFSAIFASGVVVAMEKELPERASQILAGEKPFAELPSDVRKIIATNTMRLILDEAENNPEMLMQEKEKSLSFMQMWQLGPFVRQFTMPIIDFIILLIENGANPNIKSNQGNTVLHLLVAGLLVKVNYWKSCEKDTAFEISKYMNALMVKIELLMRHAINVNEQNNNGDTIAHTWIQVRLSTPFLLVNGSSVESTPDIVQYTHYLMSNGLDFTTVKIFEGLKACQVGLKEIRKNQWKLKWKNVLRDIYGCEGQ